MTAQRPRDLLVYFALSVLPIAGFWLSGYPDTSFFVSLFVISALVLVMFRVWHKEQGLVQYDSDLGASSMLYVVLGALGSLAVASFLVSRYAQQQISSVYVPFTKLGLSVGTMLLPPFVSDVLFTLTLVTPAEETSKLVTTNATYGWLKDKFGETVAKVCSIGLPIAGWAVLHVYRNAAYQGVNMFITVLSAFIAGLMIFYVMHKTKSLLAAILCHSLYNIVVLYTMYYLPVPAP